MLHRNIEIENAQYDTDQTKLLSQEVIPSDQVLQSE